MSRTLADELAVANVQEALAHARLRAWPGAVHHLERALDAIAEDLRERAA